jgi:hypothetical protein
MELDALVERAVDQLAAVGFHHRYFLDAVAPLRVEPGGVVDEAAARLDLGGEAGQALTDGLLVPERRAEGLASLHVIERDLQRFGRFAERHGAQRDALVLEVAHDRVEAASLFAQQLRLAAVEGELGRIGGAPAHLVQAAAHREAGSALLHDEHRDALRAGRGIGLGGHEVHVGMHAVGDEHLAAGELPALPAAHRPRADSPHVRPRVRLGHRHRRDAFAGHDVRHPPLQLLGRPGVPQVGRGHVGMHQDRDREAAEGRASQLLGENRGAQCIEPRPAVLFRMPQAEKAELPHFPQHFTRDHACLFPRGAVRDDIVFDEAAEGLAEKPVRVLEIRAVSHP